MEITAVEGVYLGNKTACLKIETNEGIAGYGEPVVEMAPLATLSLVDSIAEQYLLGRDPRPIAKHRRRMEDALWYNGGPIPVGATAGIEMALWDIKARDLGVPVYELLGGPVREEVRMYTWIGGDGRDEIARAASDLVDRGWDALKFKPFPADPSPYPHVVEEAEAMVRAVREAVGPDIDLMLDPASRWKLAEAKAIVPALARFDPLFVEDVIQPTPVETVAKLTDHVSVPYALGDRLTGLEEFQAVIDRDAAAVVQPDICHSGGLKELTHIAAAAEGRGIRVAPHNPQGPIATAAAVHLDLSIPNFLIQEVAKANEDAWENEYIDTSVVDIEQGRIPAPERPGLGIEVNDALFEAEYAGHGDTPLAVDPSHGNVPEW